jgi:hypothetical protein
MGASESHTPLHALARKNEDKGGERDDECGNCGDDSCAPAHCSIIDL